MVGRKDQQAAAPAAAGSSKIYLTGVPPPLPKDVTLSDVMKTLPPEVFQKSALRAWQRVAFTVLNVAVGVWMISVAPWYMLPLAWFVTGTGLTGCFVIGHDCGHRAFSNNRWINDTVGVVILAPTLYPMEAWRIQHNYHHQHTNKLHVDNAWQPFQPAEFDQAWLPMRLLMRLSRSWLMFWMSSIVHWAREHFDLSLFEPRDRRTVALHIGAVLLFFVGMCAYVLPRYGVAGVLSFFVMPWLVFHFWMSTFTLLHHTAPHIPFLPEGQWNEAQARLGSTVHCKFPWYIELMCHDINVHIPHHLSTAIPSYNLWRAHDAIKARWGRYIHETVFGWDLLREVTSKCNLYHEDKVYTPFDSR